MMHQRPAEACFRDGSSSSSSSSGPVEKTRSLATILRRVLHVDDQDSAGLLVRQLGVRFVYSVLSSRTRRTHVEIDGAA